MGEFLLNIIEELGEIFKMGEVIVLSPSNNKLVNKKKNPKIPDYAKEGIAYDPWSRGYGSGDQVYTSGIQTPPTTTYEFLYYMAYHEVTYRTCCQILKMYHFREGLEWTNQQKYEPQVKLLNEFFNRVNTNDQTFLEVLFQIEDDFNIADDVYLCFNRNYYVDNKTGEILHSTIKEIYRGNPMYYRLVTRDNTRIGGHFGRCLVCERERYKNQSHYEFVLNSKSRYASSRTNNVVFKYHPDMFDQKIGWFRCPICGCKLHDVVAIVSDERDSESPMFFHIEPEVIHASKYSPSRLYGRSPIITLSNQMDVKIRFNQYLQSFLEFNRVPQGAIFINTGNAEQVKRTLQQAEKNLIEDRYYMPILAIDSQTNGTIANYIKFTPYPEELQMHETQNWLRREIASLLGVQNVMLNDLEGVGGLNSESLQVQVTDRAALSGQIVYNEKLFPRLLHRLAEYGQFEIPEDLRLIVKRTDNAENETRLVNLERSINIALAIIDMGYEAEPDFANLIGPDNKKILPFSFKKLTKSEIQEQIELGLMEGGGVPDRGDKVKNPQTATRSKIPGFRTKMLKEQILEVLPKYRLDQLLKRDDMPRTICKIKDKLVYKVNFTDYEYGYISSSAFELIQKIKESQRSDKILEKRHERYVKTVQKLYNHASESTRHILNIASMIALKKKYNKSDLPYLIEDAVKLYVGTS